MNGFHAKRVRLPIRLLKRAAVFLRRADVIARSSKCGDTLLSLECPECSLTLRCRPPHTFSLRGPRDGFDSSFVLLSPSSAGRGARLVHKRTSDRHSNIVDEDLGGVKGQ